MRNPILIAALALAVMALVAVGMSKRASKRLEHENEAPQAARVTPPRPRIEQARAQLDRAPAEALKTIDTLDRALGRFDPERRALEIEAHVRLGQIGRARSLADTFYRTFPRNPAIARIERLTGHHPRPYGPP
jgi:hypothetical protein